MVKITEIDAVRVTAESQPELLRAIASELEERKLFDPEVQYITKTEAIIYQTPVEADTAMSDESEWSGRYCCECDIYDWGKGCPFREGHVTLKMQACEHFTINL